MSTLWVCPVCFKRFVSQELLDLHRLARNRCAVVPEAKERANRGGKRTVYDDPSDAGADDDGSEVEAPPQKQAKVAKKSRKAGRSSEAAVVNAGQANEPDCELDLTIFVKVDL
jgi:hypothetical protein